MGQSVPLDRSGWTVGALARSEKIDRWVAAAKARRAWDATPAGLAYAEAVANHPLRGALDGIGDEEVQASRDHAPYLFKAWDAQNGHREALAMRKYVNPRAALERAIRRDLAWMVPRGLGDRERSVASAAQRAKQDVRRLCKVMKVNSLWTLTYRANVQDRDLVVRHFDAFRRRVAAVLGGWRYICVAERQERGAYHLHLATHALPVYLVAGGVRVKSWDVMRRIWRSVVGELGGNFDESKRSHWWRPGARAVRSCSSIASYIAGYVAKDMLDGDLNRKRFSHSRGIEVPECYRAWFAAAEVSMHGLIELCYAALGDRIGRVWFDKERAVFYAESDDSSG